jgi:hypothetical protein
LVVPCHLLPPAKLGVNTLHLYSARPGPLNKVKSPRDQGKWWLSPTEIRGNSWWFYRENYVFWAYLTIFKQQKIGSLWNLGLTRRGVYAFALGLSYRGTQQQFNGLI